MTRKICLPILLFFLFHSPGQSEVQGSAKYKIRNVTIIDGTGRQPYLGTVSIAGGRIVEVQDNSEPGAGDSIEIDGSGKYLIPGLWDMHVHLAADEPHPEALEMLVRSGVTTVRDMGGHLDVLSKWKAEITGEIESARIS